MIDTDTFVQEAQAMKSSLYRMSMNILHRSVDAEDAVQQALLKAWAARNRVDITYFRPWLMRIAINECRNVQRHKKRVTPMEIVTETIDKPDILKEIYEAIDALPEKMRILIMLKYMEQYSEKEIAMALGITLGAVKGQLFRAREALKRELKDEMVVEFK